MMEEKWKKWKKWKKCSDVNRRAQWTIKIKCVFFSVCWFEEERVGRGLSNRANEATYPGT